jgi:hypothetical protein
MFHFYVSESCLGFESLDCFQSQTSALSLFAFVLWKPSEYSSLVLEHGDVLILKSGPSTSHMENIALSCLYTADPLKDCTCWERYNGKT